MWYNWLYVELFPCLSYHLIAVENVEGVRGKFYGEAARKSSK